MRAAHPDIQLRNMCGVYTRASDRDAATVYMCVCDLFVYTFSGRVCAAQQTPRALSAPIRLALCCTIRALVGERTKVKIHALRAVETACLVYRGVFLCVRAQSVCVFVREPEICVQCATMVNRAAHY